MPQRLLWGVAQAAEARAARGERESGGGAGMAALAGLSPEERLEAGCWDVLSQADKVAKRTWRICAGYVVCTMVCLATAETSHSTCPKGGSVEIWGGWRTSPNR